MIFVCLGLPSPTEGIGGVASWFKVLFDVFVLFCVSLCWLFCCRLLHDMHSFSPFALGCCFFRSGTSSLNHSERREVGGVLWLRVGPLLAWSNDPTVLGKCRTRCSVSYYHHFSPLPFSDVPSWTFSYFELFVWLLGPARPRGWRQCCLVNVMNEVVLPCGVEERTSGPTHISYLLVSLLCRIWIILHGGLGPN